MPKVSVAIKYEFSAFNPPQPLQSFVTVKINDFGKIAGTVMNYTPAGRLVGPTSFIYDHGTFTTPTNVPAPVNDLNDSGELVGNGPGGGFIYKNGTVSTIAGPDAGSLEINGVNNLGQLAGYANNQGFIMRNGAFETIAPPGATFASSQALNDFGQVVGLYWDASMAEHGFLYSNGGYTTIDAPAATFVEPTGINDWGEIVGTYKTTQNGFGIDHGFVYDHGKLTTVDVPGATQTTITDVNNLGQIAGRYVDGTGGHGFVGSAHLTLKVS